MFQIQFMDRNPAPVTLEEETFIYEQLKKALEVKKEKVATIPLDQVESLPLLKRKLMYVSKSKGMGLVIKKKGNTILLDFDSKYPRISMTKDKAEGHILESLNQAAQTRAELSRSLNLTAKRVGLILKDLIEAKKVQKKGSGPNTTFEIIVN